MAGQENLGGNSEVAIADVSVGGDIGGNTPDSAEHYNLYGPSRDSVRTTGRLALLVAAAALVPALITSRGLASATCDEQHRSPGHTW